MDSHKRDEALDQAPPASSVHKRALELVLRAWDGEISAQETERLVAHLEECAECAAAAARLRAFLATLHREARADPRTAPTEESGRDSF